MIDTTTLHPDQVQSRSHPARPVPTSKNWRAKLEKSRLLQFLMIAVLALLFRGATFGEWNYDVDEQFFALVGQRILEGDVLYVDIWDRKPPALYLVYSGIALVSKSFLAFHLGATLIAILGAYGVTRIARYFAPTIPALMAGASYLALMGRFGGASGQAPVWYTTLMIYAAWAIISRIETLRRGRIDFTILAGMAAGGLAVAFKQSAAIEVAFFGLVIAGLLLSSPEHRARGFGLSALLAVISVLPIAATFAWYAHIHRLPELWQALVTSNFTRLYVGTPERILRFGVMLSLLSLPLLFAVLSWFGLTSEERREPRFRFVTAWAVVAVLSVASFPNIYYHYAIPILPPLCIMGAMFFARPRVGWFGFVAVLTLGLFYGNTLNLTTRLRAHAAAPELVEYVRAETPNKQLLVWGMPNYLYALVGSKPPSRLAFPPHLYDGAESGASGIDDVEEMRRILADGPETVVVQNPIPARPINKANIAQVSAYLKTCETMRSFTIYDHDGSQVQDVYSRCGQNR